MKKAKSNRKTSRKSSPRAPSWLDHVTQKVWPQERDFFERPERYRYVRKLVPQSECVFCDASKMGVGPESLVLYQDNLCLVIMNKYPYNSGHLLLLPRAHVGKLTDVEDSVIGALAIWQKRCVGILTELLGCQGFNLGLNHGAVAGAGIPGHLHWHVVPRWNGDTNFFPIIAETKVLPETLEMTYSRLAPFFQVKG